MINSIFGYSLKYKEISAEKMTKEKLINVGKELFKNN